MPDLHRRGVQQAQEIGRGDADEEAARAAVDVDDGQVQDGAFDVHRHRLARAERRGAAHQVARVPVRDVRLARLDVLAADLAGELLGRHLEIAVHQHDERRARLVLHHERLDDGVLVDAQLARRHARAAVLLVAVEMLGVRDTGGAQNAHRRCHRRSRLPAHRRASTSVRPASWSRTCAPLRRHPCPRGSTASIPSASARAPGRRTPSCRTPVLSAAA